MSRYFFHLVDGSDVLLDPDGIEISPDQIASRALYQARALIASDAGEGRINLRCSIEVKDEAGKLVHSLAFEDAVSIVRDEAGG